MAFSLFLMVFASGEFGMVYIATWSEKFGNSKIAVPLAAAGAYLTANWVGQYVFSSGTLYC